MKSVLVSGILDIRYEMHAARHGMCDMGMRYKI